MSSITDMSHVFFNARLFEGAISKWDVSNVRDMSGMFQYASSFNGDISRWDVSSVVNMDSMFQDAVSFDQNLCGAAWVHSKASKNLMFEESFGSISQTVCTSVLVSTPATHRYVSRRPLPDRELIIRTPIAAPVSTPAITSTNAISITCPKCGTFRKSGRVSCCAPGGAWYKNCGGAGNKNVDHRWLEGVEACKRKCKVKGM